MIDITKTQANQTSTENGNSDWTVTLDDELLYTLPAHFSVQETFLVRDIVEAMMKRASDEMKEQEQQLCLVKIQHVTSHGDAKLDFLKRENIRLSDALETLMKDEVA